MKKVAVVILNWNGKALLEQFLPSVMQYTDQNLAEIVVADNASTDDSVSFLNQYYPAIRVIRLKENYGFAEGYNQALTQIDAEYSLLLNSDVEVVENWLEPLVEFMDNNPDVGAVQPKLRWQRHKDLFEYAGAAGGYLDKYGYPFCRGRILGIVEKDNGQYDTIKDVFWASGACFLIRTNEFFEFGGFDSLFFAHMEEIDLCWRINARGKRIVCVSESTVYHVGGATLAEESPRKTFLNFRNNLLMLYKNLPKEQLTTALRVRKYLDFLAMLQFYLTGKLANGKAVRDARREFKQTKHLFKAKREENLKKMVSCHTLPVYDKSLLWSFYVKGQKVFSKLKF